MVFAMKTNVLEEIRYEREHQIVDLGYNEQWDDEYKNYQLVKAAICYANPLIANLKNIVPSAWPFDKVYWKPRTYRENLIRAAALIVAEIERVDRIK